GTIRSRLKFNYHFSSFFLAVIFCYLSYGLVYGSINRSGCKPFNRSYIILTAIILTLSRAAACCQCSYHTYRQEHTKHFLFHVFLSFFPYNFSVPHSPEEHKPRHIHL